MVAQERLTSPAPPRIQTRMNLVTTRRRARGLKFLILAAATTAGVPARAVVGGAPAAPASLAPAIVTIVGSRGNFCSGVAVSRRVVLTAAHCLRPDASYKVVIRDQGREPRLADIAAIERHPRFDAAAIQMHRATADVALARLAEPLPATVAPARVATPRVPIEVGARFTIVGIGVAREGDGRSGGVPRAADLVATGRPGNLQIRLIDPAATSAGRGACTGDSGGPVFEEQDGRAVVVGVIAWSTGPNATAGCGGMTGVTPLSLYGGWVSETLRRLDPAR